MKTLSHNTLIRLPSWADMYYATVGTNHGFYRDRGWEPEGENSAWSTFAGSMLSNSPAYYDNEKKKAACAVTIEEGETVEIERIAYKVKVMPGNGGMFPKNSDPIHFEKV